MRKASNINSSINYPNYKRNKGEKAYGIFKTTGRK